MAQPLDRTWYNTLIDDDGSGTTGTVWNKTAVDGLLDSVDASLATVLDKAGGPALNQIAIFHDADTVKSDARIMADVVAGGITIDSTYYPYLQLRDTSQAANARRVHIVMSGGSLFLAPVDDAGAVIAGGSVVIARAGRMTLQSGQLTFPTVQNPSTDPYTLDDYRESAWTPTLTSSGGASGQSYTTQSAFAIKHGSLVVCKGAVQLSVVGTFNAGNIRIAGFPFPNRGGSHNSIGSIVFNALGAPVGGLSLFMPAGATYGDLVYLAAGGGTTWGYAAASHLAVGTLLTFELAYHANA